MPRGGARPGSGPKPKPDAMVKRMFVLRQSDVDRLNAIAYQTGASKSLIVRLAITNASPNRVMQWVNDEVSLLMERQRTTQ